MIRAGCPCRGCPSQAWCLSSIPPAVGSVGSTSHLSDPTPTLYSHQPALGPLSWTWSFLLSLWLGADQGGSWTGSHTLNCHQPAPVGTLIPTLYVLPKKPAFPPVVGGGPGSPGGLGLRICSRREKMSGAAASGQNFAQGVIRTSTGSAEMNQQPRRGSSKSGLVRTVVRSMERLLVQGHRSWSPSKCITQWDSPCAGLTPLKK